MTITALDAVSGAMLAFYLAPLGKLLGDALDTSKPPPTASTSPTQWLVVGVTLVGVVLSAITIATGSTVLLLVDCVVFTFFLVLGVYSYAPEVQRWWAARSSNAQIGIATGGVAVMALLVGGVALLLPAPSTKAGPKRTTNVAALRAKLLATYGGHGYSVYGTCVTSDNCGLNERPKPDDHAEPMGARHQEGRPLTVVCQAKGTVVVDPPDQRSAIWDRLDNGKWITDLYVKTPGSAKGEFSQEIERCR
jgi:hypothetical protein